MNECNYLDRTAPASPPLTPVPALCVSLDAPGGAVRMGEEDAPQRKVLLRRHPRRYGRAAIAGLKAGFLCFYFDVIDF